MLDKKRLMGAIVASGMTQKKLAEKIGMSKNTINAKINGKGNFDTEEIDKICDVLNINNDKEKVLIFLSKPSQKRDDKKCTPRQTA